jgi:hypothetical protein
MVIVPACTFGFIFGIFKLYLLLATSFSICTPSLLEISLPLIDLNRFIKSCEGVCRYKDGLMVLYHDTTGLGKDSMKHSYFTLPSFLTGPTASGSFVNTGAP